MNMASAYVPYGKRKCKLCGEKNYTTSVYCEHVVCDECITKLIMAVLI